MRKRIGLFIAEIAWDYQETISKRIIEHANSLGYDVAVICSYGSFKDNYLYAEGEKACLNLPDCSCFDGIIATEDVFDIPGMADELYEILKRDAKCPVVYLRSHREGYHTILVENTNSIQNMVKHFTDIHGFTNVCYMSGKEGWLDTEQRLQGYLNAMAERNLPVTEHMIFQGDFWRQKGAEALDWFLDGGTTYPQAIVCANDYMALSICDELLARGIKVPEDVCVSGFDFVAEARVNTPSLTSLAIDFNELATKAVDIIDRVNKGENVDYVQHISTKMQLQGSCGCGRTHFHEFKNIFASSHKQVTDTKDIMLSAIDYQDSFAPEEFMDVAHRYRRLVRSDKIIFCFNNNEDSTNAEVENDNKFTSLIRLRDVFDGDKPIQKNDILFPRKELLPAEFWSDDEPNNYFFFCMHFKNKVYGYIATTIPKDEWFDIFTQDYFMNFANAVENSVVHEQLEHLEEIRALYQKDPLTDIYNRRGFDKLLRNDFSQAKRGGNNFALVSIDMDNLKPINDNFGHSAGDNALVALASTLNLLMLDGEYCGRIGGDEFAAVLKLDNPNRIEEFREQFANTLKEESEKIADYSVEASVGIVEFREVADLPFVQMLYTVDQRMYAEKRAKKAARA